MTRILTFTLSLSRNAGGLFTSVRRLTQSILPLGYNIQVLGPMDQFSAEDIGAWLPLTPQAYIVKGPRGFGYCPNLERRAMSLEPQLLHQHGLWMYHSTVNNQVARKLGIPYLLSPRGMLDSWALQNSRWKKRFAWWAYERRNLSNATCIHALCDSELASIRKLGLRNPVCLVPNGVDIPETLQVRRTQSAKRTFLFIGRIHPKKGLELIVDALGKLKLNAKNQELDFQVIIAGWDDGGHLQTLQQRCQKCNILWTDASKNDLIRGEAPGDIVYAGPVFGARKQYLLNHCDAFILPSYSEGLPVAVLEAWANELPVLMTDQCNLPIGFERSCATRIITSIESVAAGISRMNLASTSELREMGARGRQVVAQNFTWSAVAACHHNIFDWMLGKRDVPRTVSFFE